MLTRRSPRRRPAHPGAALRDLVAPPLGYSKTRLARSLGLRRYSEKALGPVGSTHEPDLLCIFAGAGALPIRVTA